MIPHDFMTMHTAKMVEYLIAVGYLLLFIPFWRFVNGGRQAETVPAHATRPARLLTDWFAVPDGLFYHPGHAWVRVDGPDTVTVGMDDFAGKLVGAPSAIALPSIGETVVQGAPAWAIVSHDTPLDMLSPVDGTVVAVNEEARRMPALAHRHPYADGWLLKVRNARLAANLKQLVTGAQARRWVEELTTELRGDVSPALGQLAADGGVVIDGLAHAIHPEEWDRVVRRFFLTDDGAEGGNHA